MMVGRLAAPGIPLRSRFARPRPPYAGAKGDWDGLRCWIPACAGMTEGVVEGRGVGAGVMGGGWWFGGFLGDFLIRVVIITNQV